MKKILLLTFALLSIFSVSASYKFLEFKDAEGTSVYVYTQGLTIKVDGQDFAISNSNDQSLTLDWGNLAMMKFTNSDESNSIKEINFEDEEVSVYSLDGFYHGNYVSARDAANSLENGVYIIKVKSGKSVKIVVNK